MANKQNFTPEEWSKILGSTMAAGMAVSAASPQILFGPKSKKGAAKVMGAVAGILRFLTVYARGGYVFLFAREASVLPGIGPLEVRQQLLLGPRAQSQ
jgi:hypothetical protein